MISYMIVLFQVGAGSSSAEAGSDRKEDYRRWRESSWESRRTGKTARGKCQRTWREATEGRVTAQGSWRERGM